MECRLSSWSWLASDGRRRAHRICARHLPRLAPRPLALPTLQRNWLTAQRRHIHLPRLLHPLARQQRHYLPTSTLCCKKHYGFASSLIIAIILPIPKKDPPNHLHTNRQNSSTADHPKPKKLRTSHAKPTTPKHLPLTWEVLLYKAHACP